MTLAALCAADDPAFATALSETPSPAVALTRYGLDRYAAGDFEHAAQIFRVVADAAPDDIDAAFAAADVAVLDHEIGAAFERLTGLVKRTSGDDRTRVRTRLIELFDLFDPADPDVIAGRRNLANALY